MASNDEKQRQPNGAEIRFALGRTLITPGALEVLTHEDTSRALTCHQRGEWGELCREDREENDLSLREGFRLLSAYRSAHGVKFWVITEADRSATTILLPEEY